MSAQIVQIRPLPVLPPINKMTHEEYKDFLETLAVFMAAGHRMGEMLQRRKKTIPAIRMFGAVRVMASAHDLLTREALAIQK